MIKAIVYESNTGHTKQYAEMLGKELGISALTIKEASKTLDKNDEIIFLGWIFATKIKGLSKMNRYNIKCVGAVGIYPEGREYIDSLIKANNLNKKMFYLRGGLNFNKLTGFKKTLLQWVGKMIKKENKPENQELIKLFKHGANFVSESNLRPMIEYIKGIQACLGII